MEQSQAEQDIAHSNECRMLALAVIAATMRDLVRCSLKQRSEAFYEREEQIRQDAFEFIMSDDFVLWCQAAFD